MNPIRNILAIVDPTVKDQPAVTKAAALAKYFDAQLELLACETPVSHAARHTAHARKRPTEPFVTDLLQVLEKLAGQLRASGLTVTTATKYAEPLYATLLDHARKTDADLVVKDTHHHSIARRTFLSNTDWQLIRGGAAPLLLVKPHPWAHHPRIMAAVDPGHVNDKPYALDRRILDYASLLTQRLGGELHAAHAYLPGAIIAQAVAGEPPMVEILSAESLRLEEQQKRAEVISLLTDYGVTNEHVHVSVGSPTEILIRLADSLSVDVTVMGAISRSGLGRVFLGSTAEDILERLPCDALIVKSPDFSESLPF